MDSEKGLTIKENDELLDLVDQNDQVIGTVLKSSAHSNPAFIHREVVVLIFNKKNQTLIQKRSLLKKVDPGKWEVACAGHVGAGEIPEEAAKREVFEELGINIQPVFFEKQKVLNDINNESKFYWVYYAIIDDNDFELDKLEVEEVKWIDVSEVSKYIVSSDVKDTSVDTTNRISNKIKNIA